MNHRTAESLSAAAAVRRATIRPRACLRGLAMTMLTWLALAATLSAQEVAQHPASFGAPSDKSHGKFCTGELVLDQGPGAEFGLWSESTCTGCPSPAAAQILADDFVIDRAMVITELVIWGYHWPLNNPPPTETWTVIFHSDDAGSPAGVVSRQTLTPTLRTDTDDDLDILDIIVDQQRWILHLAEPAHLAAGTYWIELAHDSPIVDADTSIRYGEPGIGTGIPQNHFSAFESPGETWGFSGSSDLALQVCGADATTLGGFIIPGFEVEEANPAGPTTLFAVRNTGDESVDFEIGIFDEDFEVEMYHQSLTLAPAQTRFTNLRNIPADLDLDDDGIASGIVVIQRSDGGTAHLTGDFFQVDDANNFATGGQMLRLENFCPHQTIRFLDFGSGSEYQIMLRNPPASGSSFTVTALTPAGDVIAEVSHSGARHLNVMSLGELLPGSQFFGTLVFDFSASEGGMVRGKYSAFEQFSVELNGNCAN